MNQDQDRFPVDDRTERLISRALDGELRDDERRELDAILKRDAAARALYHDYRSNDEAAAAALRLDFERSTAAANTSRPRGLWLATAGSVLAAAAVLALFIDLGSQGGGGSAGAGRGTPAVRTDASRPLGPRAPMLDVADFRPIDYTPRERHQRLYRDVIGVQADDPDVIYIFERNTRSTESVPVRGDF